MEYRRALQALVFSPRQPEKLRYVISTGKRCFNGGSANGEQHPQQGEQKTLDAKNHRGGQCSTAQRVRYDPMRGKESGARDDKRNCKKTAQCKSNRCG